MRRGLLLVGLIVAFAACTNAATVPTPTPSPRALTPSVPTPIPPTVTPTSPVASQAVCPAGEEGFRQLAPLLDRTLRLDGATLALVTAAMANRSGDWKVDDLTPQWSGLGNDTPTVVAAAQAKGTLAGSDGMALRAGTVTIFEASLFDFGREIYPDPLGAQATTLGRDGDTLVVPYPWATGRWVLELHVEWETQCLAGDGHAYAFVETR